MSEEDSIMFYTTPGTEWSTYNTNTNNFVPVFTDDVSNWNWNSDALKDDAYDLCGADTSCLYDVYITGDLEIGAGSKATAEESERTNSQLGEMLDTIIEENK